MTSEQTDAEGAPGVATRQTIVRLIPEADASTPTIDLALSPFDAHAPAIISAAQAAERAGLGGVWTFDHLSGAVAGRSWVLECFTLLGALAQATSSLIVGPLVANVTNRHPAVIANAAAGVVVGKVGTATASIDEVRELLPAAIEAAGEGT